ncbi:hypothetical protein EC396_16540 [Lutibacter sp. HS1-25]|uniref:hypothetical protein n=1 Tax=Lutibacter sp. HS1-25 TaxID=2485000 RepID=UPI00101053A7|nr:hypothetical protein [Lutibacter sp. HS1-25]RXP44769.1 hypothetical protein EC396_16540 [Lutibacter sp. HS1-25]
MHLKKSITITVIIFIMAIGSWELYWRSQGYLPNIEDDKALWAVQRALVERASKNDIVLFGSSRVLFDFQLDAFEKETGIRPIQLATAGASPLPGFRDLVEKTTFNGTVILGVTPGLFFSTTYPMASPWNRIQSRVNYFYDRTYAQRINNILSIPLQSNFAFLRADDEEWSDDLNLKSLISRIKIGNRTNNQIPPFYRFSDIDLDRNVKMSDKTEKDTAFANTIIKVWGYFGSTSPPPDKESTMAFFMEDVERFTARGGNLILVRCPSSGGVRVGENMAFPRSDFWDDLISKTNVKSYHFEDYEQLKHFECPEWSHLSAKDAMFYTRELCKIMKNDGALFNLNRN